MSKWDSKQSLQRLHIQIETLAKLNLKTSECWNAGQSFKANSSKINIDLKQISCIEESRSCNRNKDKAFQLD